MKRFHYTGDFIKEEINEDEDSESSFASHYSARTRFSSFTVMPKDRLIFREKKKMFTDPINIITTTTKSIMEPVPETDDDGLCFQKPNIRILVD